jgi:hypothetical protein
VKKEVSIREYLSIMSCPLSAMMDDSEDSNTRESEKQENRLLCRWIVGKAGGRRV